MKEIPILFSTPMVQAILDLLKGMTRRTRGLEKMNEAPDNWRLYEGDYFIDKKGRINQKFFNVNGHSDHAKCPYGQPGDVLWVRESFCIMDGDIFFKASVNHPETLKWKPSIYILKANARIWLQVEEIRVERLQYITEEDARREGVKFAKSTIGPCYLDYIHGGYNVMTTAYHSFRSLWRKINGSESWDLNPWVWVVKFKVLSTTGKPEKMKEPCK